MTLHQWIGVTIGLLLVGFIFFAFRQGEKVKPSGRENNKGLDDVPSTRDLP
jgi:cbb3-type cytochrome oxidase subunit 3